MPAGVQRYTVASGRAFPTTPGWDVDVTEGSAAYRGLCPAHLACVRYSAPMLVIPLVLHEPPVSDKCPVAGLHYPGVDQWNYRFEMITAMLSTIHRPRVQRAPTENGRFTKQHVSTILCLFRVTLTPTDLGWSAPSKLIPPELSEECRRSPH